MLYKSESRVVVGCKSRNLTRTKRANIANQKGDQDYLVSPNIIKIKLFRFSSDFSILRGLSLTYGRVVERSRVLSCRGMA